MGTLNWPLDKEGGDPPSEDVVRRSIELGVDFFDTAEAIHYNVYRIRSDSLKIDSLA